MENELDGIASGDRHWEEVLDKFFGELESYLHKKIDDILISDKDEFKTRQVLDLLNEELHDFIFPKTPYLKPISSCSSSGKTNDKRKIPAIIFIILPLYIYSISPT